ncbi:MAG: hypothetical protein US54_C0017G0006 [Candidatus Roizmanbacteria bacterium GW2011_GWA2_37_7]|uniref:Glycosyltransferase RgtA/B/C/D-like domain-containing protein n=1 Tax=Candidatus Roizmanbacteria bacterium GW2011_GWA2_37_7 TaxID=1618481 RepID=A0A0G0HI01_9BACT|nr:MAG: hypothetical protein US54_C0017G0006 [Candidatus Roizmanbacteria bacterium GW2011_GWA2_37_7]
MFSIEELFIYLKKTFTKKDVLLIGGIVLLYFISRLINLDQWPIFSDEGIYIRWAKVAWKDASWRFISITDGRQPLQTWATIPFLKIFPDDMLFAGRLFSVTTGFIGLTGMFSLLMYLWGKRAAIIGATLYVFLPYFVFYDRIALVDSAVNAGFIWILFFSLWLARKRRLDTALFLGFIGGFALLAKSSSRMFLMLAALAPLLYLDEKKKKMVSYSINYLLLLGFAFAISFFFYNVQRLSPFFHYVALKNTTFVMTFDEFLKTPFAYVHNFKYIPLYIAWESGWFIVPLSIAGLYFLFKNEKLFASYLSIFIVLPYIAISFFAKILFPRYVLFYGSILIITATYFFIQTKSAKLTRIILLLLIVSMTIINYPLLFNPARASFPPVDRGQYITGVTAVWGVENLMNLMREKSKLRPVYILAEGDFGLVADVLKVYIKEKDNIEVRGLWPLDQRHLIEYQNELLENQVYIVFSHRQEFPDDWPMKFVQKYGKPEGDKALYLYELLPVASEFSIISKN